MPLVFRRRIEIRLHHAGRQTQGRATLEDDYHHFRVAMQLRDGVVQTVEAQAPRHPYSLCPQAQLPLQGLKGHRVGERLDLEPRQQCTHMLDLASLTLGAISAQRNRTLYTVEVTRRDAQDRATARLWRDGQPWLDWGVQGWTIESPPHLAGAPVRQGLARWAREHLAAEWLEPMLVLQRCTMIAIGRERDLDLEIHARESGQCFAQQPERAPQALRQHGTTLDFTARADQLCLDDQTWLDQVGQAA